MLFYTRQKVTDLLTQQAVNIQGYLALDLIRKNNLELVKGVDRATTTTVPALRTAVIVAQALNNQKLVLDQIAALNTTTGRLIAGTSEMLRDQSAAIHQQAASSTIEIAKLQPAFTNIYQDDGHHRRLQDEGAGVDAVTTVDTLSDEVAKSADLPGPGAASGIRRGAAGVGRGALAERRAPRCDGMVLVALLSMALVLGGCGRRESDAPPARTAEAGNAEAAFTVLAGSEVKDLEPAIVAAGRSAGVTVRMSYAGTLDIVERINAGERFDAILPPNGAYPSLALQTPPLAREKLFYSRIALGVKAAKVAELGWSQRAPTWADIAKAASTGRLRYAMTNAASSNSGMSALFAVAAASSGKTEDMAASDVDAKVITAFLSGQRDRGQLRLGWPTPSRDPAAIDAMVNYEAVILRANEKLAQDQRLTLVYPRDGMISADYPLMLLREAAARAVQQAGRRVEGGGFPARRAGPRLPAARESPGRDRGGAADGGDRGALIPEPARGHRRGADRLPVDLAQAIDIDLRAGHQRIDEGRAHRADARSAQGAQRRVAGDDQRATPALSRAASG